MFQRKLNGGWSRPAAVFSFSSFLSVASMLVTAAPTLAQPFPPANDPLDEARQEAGRQAKAQAYYNQGQQLLAEGKIVQAKTKFKAAIGVVGLQGTGSAAFAALQQIHGQGMAEIEKAIGLTKQEKYIEALEVARAARSIYANIFAGLNIQHNFPNIAHLARKIEEQLEKNPAAQAQIQEKEASSRLRRIKVLERKAKDDPARYYDLYKAYRSVARGFPDCATGRDCATQMEKLESDKKVWRMINDERKCRWIEDKLQSIEMLQKNGLDEKARARFKELTDRFGDRSAADFRRLVAEKRPKPEKVDE